MKQFRELNACIAALQALRARDDVESEQEKEVDRVIELVKRLRRYPQLKQQEVYRCVREITERLVRAFVK